MNLGLDIFRKFFARVNYGADSHMRILRYADQNPGFYFDDMRTELGLSNELVRLMHKELGEGSFFKNIEGGDGRGYRYALTFEGKSRLLEYDELVLARKNSREAKWFAIVAILISIGVGAVQMLQIQDVNVVTDPIPVLIQEAATTT